MLAKQVTVWSQNCHGEGALVATVVEDGEERPSKIRITLDRASAKLRELGYVFVEGGRSRHIGEIEQFSNTYRLREDRDVQG